MRLRLKYCVLSALLLIVTLADAYWGCSDFDAKLPNVKRALCTGARLRPGGSYSVQGRPLLVSDSVPRPLPQPLPQPLPKSLPKSLPTHVQQRVLVIAAMHGDEFSAASLALHWLKQAQQAPGQTHWRFIPLLNPDGLMHKPPQRANAHGVDLNRNFPTPDWQNLARRYWERDTRKDPRRWPGKAPLSEPESTYLFNQIKQFAPHVIVSIHAPYGVLDFDGPVMPPTRLGRLYLSQVGIFPGSLGNYAGVQGGIPVVTVELPNARRTPPDAEMQKMWNDLRTWLDRTPVSMSAP